MDVRRCCGNCAHARRPTDRFLKMALHDFPGLLICFRCCESEGEMNGVSPVRLVPELSANDASRRRSRPVDKPGMRRNHSRRREESQAEGVPNPAVRGLVTVVDPGDFKELSKYKWYAIGKSPHIYAVRSEKGRIIYMHRQIMKAAERPHRGPQGQRQPEQPPRSTCASARGGRTWRTGALGTGRHNSWASRDMAINGWRRLCLAGSTIISASSTTRSRRPRRGTARRGNCTASSRT